jgi:hypothetical protein
VEVELEGLVGDVLVDEQPLLAEEAVADEGDEVLVVDAADDLHLGAELAVALPAAGAQLLDGHLLTAQRAAVHVPEPALPEQVRVREPVRRRRQVVVPERAARDRRRRVQRRHRGLGRPAAALPRVHQRRRRGRRRRRRRVRHVRRRHRPPWVVELGWCQEQNHRSVSPAACSDQKGRERAPLQSACGQLAIEGTRGRSHERTGASHGAPHERARCHRASDGDRHPRHAQ